MPSPRPLPTQGWGSDEYFREQRELQQREKGTQNHDIYFENNDNNIQTDDWTVQSPTLNTIPLPKWGEYDVIEESTNEEGERVRERVRKRYGELIAAEMKKFEEW